MGGIELMGFKELSARLEKIRKEIPLLNVQTIEDILSIGQKAAVQDAPLGETGQLRAGIRYELSPDGVSGILISSAPYSYWVNFGSSTHKAVPFFSNAVNLMDLQLLIILRKNARDLMKGQLIRQKRDKAKMKPKFTKVHKYLYKTYSRSGKQQHIYSKNRAGTVKSRGKIYSGRNYRRRFEST